MVTIAQLMRARRIRPFVAEDSNALVALAEHVGDVGLDLTCAQRHTLAMRLAG